MSDERSVAPAWRTWVTENLLAGVESTAIADALVSRGMPRPQADSIVHEVTTSPIYAAARALAVRARRLDAVAELMVGQQRAVDPSGAVERVAGLSPDDFFRRYYAASTPVVLTDVVTRWRAFGLWSPAYFAERLGDVEVEVTTDREADPDCDLNTDRHRQKLTMRAFAQRVGEAGVSNDLYLIAQNRNMDRPELQGLYDDVTLDPAMFDPKRLPGSVALWFGPQGTVTPLHHDTCNILLCQVYGRKRVRLVAPWEPSLLKATRGVYSTVNLDRPETHAASGFSSAVVRDVTLEAGEAVFIPCGWWHDVRSLAVSINLAFANFARPNFFDWYRPGAIR